MTQQTALLELLRKGPVTPLKAWIEAGIYRPAYLVHRMRGDGYKIETVIKPFTTSRGVAVKFATYTLIKEPRRRRAA